MSGQPPRTPETSTPRLDILLALHRTAQAVRADLVAILLGGGLLVSLPGYAARLLAPEGGYTADVATLVTTGRAVLAMLYLALVSWGVVARLTGRALPDGVEVVENKPLARALYDAIEVDQMIPTEHFQAVAEIISYVFRRKGKI